MTWLSTDDKSEKMKFIGDWLKNEFTMTDLCKRYGISRKTGYNLIERYNAEGEGCINERNRAHFSHPYATPKHIVKKLLELKSRYPKWGPAKIRDFLLLNGPGKDWPASSTIGNIYERHGLVKARVKRRRVVPHSQPFTDCNKSNSVWSADFKGQFRLGNGKYIYPLTITDNFSRFIISYHGLLSPNSDDSIKIFQRAFLEYGLPDAIRTDNGQPFASTGIGAVTRLSIMWLKLGIIPERIELAHPEQNGRHERMHRTLKDAVAKPPRMNQKQQQESFDNFVREYNQERPHQGLNGRRPADVYKISHKKLPTKITQIEYPAHFEVRKVKLNGSIKWLGKIYYVSELLYGEPLGFEIIDEGRAKMYFAGLSLGLIDVRTNKITRL
jgi:transposase InsO family protein